ncbi:HAD family hydrolase [Camelliibacillus cellulosilyticus]|uniref:HAD family hydrolase n=1 Tax=Camelliibacillus cellulosilyticus TaxID=2174486 RepID=A0ABV9GKC9_9BACL
MINTVLFDIDGVLLSEERCFDASALAVWELIHSPSYLGVISDSFTTDLDEPAIRRIREHIFDDDRILKFMKDRGLNSNWDMVFLAFSYQLIQLMAQAQSNKRAETAKLISGDIDHHTLDKIGDALPTHVKPSFATFIKDFETCPVGEDRLFQHLNELAYQKLGVSASFSRDNALWEIGRGAYQEWYVGDQYVEKAMGKKAFQPGKKGFLHDERALAPKEEIAQLFHSLKQKGLTLGIGTGRPDIETYEPLNTLGVTPFVDQQRIVTSDDALRAEVSTLTVESLGKPHPYTYLQGYFGKRVDASTVLNTPLPLPNAKDILIVGDSVADALAAQKIGARFAAVLTGLTGKEARRTFEQLNADDILDNVCEMPTILV